MAPMLKAKSFTVVLFICSTFSALASEQRVLSGTSIENQVGHSSTGGPMLLAPFKYIPSIQGAGNSRALVSELPQRSAPHQALVQLYMAGNYQALGTQGLSMQANEKLDDELQLMIANSLAWTGRLSEANSAYLRLTNGKYTSEANIGIANIHRWNGRDDLAAPIYKAILSTEKTNSNALVGLEQSQRELAARTIFSVGGSTDSSDTQRRSGTVNHRWRDASGVAIYELEAGTIKDSSPTSQAQQQDISFRYQNSSIALKPSLELSMPADKKRTLFGSLRVHLDDNRIAIQAGRVNWGKLANNPKALAAELTAVHSSISARYSFPVGKVSGRLNHYYISDGNNVITSNLNLDSAWRPLGSNIQPFLGLESRHASFNTTNYWSPAEGSGIAYAGLKAEWSTSDWAIYTSSQVNVPLWGEAGRGWNVSGGGKYWLTNDLAVSMYMWAMSSRRDNSPYRAQAANISLEKLWK